jgi:tetratricopeptide (TPR) repeat protein
MMAAVLRVPPAAIRHWQRCGLLVPSRRSTAVAWFEFSELVVGRQLARLLRTGLSPSAIADQLSRLVPGGTRAAAQIAERIVVEGRRLYVRCDGRLLGSGGQLQLGFAAAEQPGAPCQAPPDDPAPTAPGADDASLEADDEPATVAELLDLATDLEAAGALAEAAEALRAVLQAQGPTAEVAFMLAEVLYRSGDLTAARERYYAAVELDGDHLEARASLGCVLAELGEHDLALAALEGVIRQEPGYADAHWHIAAILHDGGREAESRASLQTFLALAPESPWAAMARERLTAAVAPPS